MKKALIALSLYVNLAFGQSAGQENKWGVSASINSIQAQVEVPVMTGTGALLVDADGNILSGGSRQDDSYSISIIPKYYLSEDFALRFEIGLTSLNLKATSDSKSAITHDLYSKQVSSSIYRYNPGFQWMFFRKKRIEAYCGMSASYINYGKITSKYYSESRNLFTDTIQSWHRVNEVTPGGFSVGIGGFSGFNIYLQKYISIGAELSSYAMYYKLGGQTTGENFEQVPRNPIDQFTTSFTNSYRGFKISKVISSFNISFWF